MILGGLPFLGACLPACTGFCTACTCSLPWALPLPASPLHSFCTPLGSPPGSSCSAGACLPAMHTGCRSATCLPGVTTTPYSGGLPAAFPALSLTTSYFTTTCNWEPHYHLLEPPASCSCPYWEDLPPPLSGGSRYLSWEGPPLPPPACYHLYLLSACLGVCLPVQSFISWLPPATTSWDSPATCLHSPSCLQCLPAPARPQCLHCTCHCSLTASLPDLDATLPLGAPASAWVPAHQVERPAACLTCTGSCLGRVLGVRLFILLPPSTCYIPTTWEEVGRCLGLPAHFCHFSSVPTLGPILLPAFTFYSPLPDSEAHCLPPPATHSDSYILHSSLVHFSCLIILGLTYIHDATTTCLPFYLGGLLSAWTPTRRYLPATTSATCLPTLLGSACLPGWFTVSPAAPACLHLSCFCLTILLSHLSCLCLPLWVLPLSVPGFYCYRFFVTLGPLRGSLAGSLNLCLPSSACRLPAARLLLLSFCLPTCLPWVFSAASPSHHLQPAWVTCWNLCHPQITGSCHQLLCCLHLTGSCLRLACCLPAISCTACLPPGSRQESYMPATAASLVHYGLHHACVLYLPASCWAPTLSCTTIPACLHCCHALGGRWVSLGYLMLGATTCSVGLPACLCLPRCSAACYSG